MPEEPRVICAAAALAAALALAACGSSAGTATSTTAARAADPCASGAQAPPSRVTGAPLDTILRVPARARGHRAPLILALHFATGTGAQMERESRYTGEASRSGFVVAYPTASANHFWAIDRDLGRLTKTLDAIESVACVDPARVYVSGISNGGFMATVLACRMADRVAAAALFAPGINGIGACAPSRPVPVLEVHGTSDPIVPYRGVPAFIAGWARRDGCASRPRAQRRGARVTLLRWPGCRGGAHVAHLRLSGGRHLEL